MLWCVWFLIKYHLHKRVRFKKLVLVTGRIYNLPIRSVFYIKRVIKIFMRASHSKDCGKGFARPEMRFIFKKYLCRSEIKNKLYESEPFQRLRKRSRPTENVSLFTAVLFPVGYKKYLTPDSKIFWSFSNGTFA